MTRADIFENQSLPPLDLFDHKARHNCAETEKHVVSLVTEWFTSKKKNTWKIVPESRSAFNLIIKCYNKHHKDHNLDNTENLCHWHLNGFLSWIVMTIRLVRVFLSQEFRKPLLVAKKYLHCSATTLFNNKLPKKSQKSFISQACPSDLHICHFFPHRFFSTQI